MIRQMKSFLTAIALMLASAPALAQDAGWFAGLGIGHMRTGDECPTTAAPGANCEDEDTTWKIFGGYQFTSYLGFELGLVDLGERPTTLGGLGAATAKFRVFELLIVGSMPLGKQLSVYGKAGIFQWDVDFEPAPGVMAGGDSNGNDFTYALGVKYHFTRSAALRLEWQRYNNVGDPGTTGRFDVDVFGVGALLSF